MAYIYDLTDTWNAGGTTFNAVKMNVTDTASAAASKLITLQTNGTEHFSVTKAGAGYFSNSVLIGTATAQGRLCVASATGNAGLNTGTSVSPERANLWYDTDGSGWNFNIGKRQGGVFTAQMTFADNNMVGVGTAPSAWVSSWRAIDVNAGGGAIFSGLALSGIANNAYFDNGSNWRYKGSYGAAAVSMGSDGSVSVNSAAAGTAGNIITFITRIYVAPSGNVIIGGSTDYPVASDRTLSVAGSSFASLNLVCGGAFGGAGLTVDSAGELQLRNNGTERMRLKANGQVRFIPLASAPGSPQAGDIYYDSTTNKLRCYNGTTWNDLF